MIQGFIRALWGIYNKEQRTKHRIWLDNDIEFCQMNKYQIPYTTFVFGEDNYKQLIDRGIQCFLVDKRPFVWDMVKEQYMHKIEVLKYGTQLFDEMIFLDWDTLPIKELPDDLWFKLSQKASLQATLRQYYRNRISWEGTDRRYVPSAAFIYIRDKNIPFHLEEIWKTIGKPWTEETVLRKYIEDDMKGWKGADYYWNYYEPYCFTLEGGCRVFNDDLIKDKNICFKTYTRRFIRKTLIGKGLTLSDNIHISKEEQKDLKLQRIARRQKKFNRWIKEGKIKV